MKIVMTQEEKRSKIGSELGWKEEEHERGDGMIVFRYLRGKKCEYQLPDYFGDSGSALLLVDHMADLGWRCELGNGLDKTWECQFMRPVTAQSSAHDIGIHQGERLEIHYAPADTLPEAVCECFGKTLRLW